LPTIILRSTTHSTPLSSRSSSAAPKLLKSRTTSLNEVASARSFDGPTSKSKPKAPTKTSKKPEIVESELENAVASGDEDDTKEREAALSSPVKGKDSRQLTAVRFTYHSPPFLIVVTDSSQGGT
jgi:hypothetical protein